MPAPPRMPLWMAAAAAAVVLALAALAWHGVKLLRARSEPPPRTIARRTVVVLPLENAGGSPETEYFSRGLTADLAARLAALRYLSVMPPPARSERDPRDAARALGADLVLQGSAARYDNRFRLRTRLVEAAGGAELAAASFDEPLSKVFDAQAQTVAEIARAMGIPAVPVSGSAPPGRNVQAYDSYLQGRRYLWDSHRADVYELSLKALTKAVQIDPGYALAYAAIAQVHARWYLDIRVEPDRLGWAEAAATRALELAPGLAPAILAFALVRASQADWEEGLEHARKALELGPGDPWTHVALAWMFERRQPPDPESVRQHAEEAIRLAPDLGPAYVELAAALALNGRHSEAEAALHRSLEVMPNSFLPHLGLAQLYLAMSSFASAREKLDTARALVPDAPLPSFYLACLEAAEGRTEEALAAWESAVQKGFQDWELVRRIPYLESIRGEERFTKLFPDAQQ